MMFIYIYIYVCMIISVYSYLIGPGIGLFELFQCFNRDHLISKGVQLVYIGTVGGFVGTQVITRKSQRHLNDIQIILCVSGFIRLRHMFRMKGSSLQLHEYPASMINKRIELKIRNKEKMGSHDHVGTIRLLHLMARNSCEIAKIQRSAQGGSINDINKHGNLGSLHSTQNTNTKHHQNNQPLVVLFNTQASPLEYRASGQGAGRGYCRMQGKSSHAISLHPYGFTPQDYLVVRKCASMDNTPIYLYIYIYKLICTCVSTYNVYIYINIHLIRCVYKYVLHICIFDMVTIYIYISLHVSAY